MTIKEELRNLQKEMEEYGEYLENETYHPYDKVQQFSRKLKDIVEVIDCFI